MGIDTKIGIELIEPTNKNLGSKPATNELASGAIGPVAVIRFPASNGKFHV